MKSPVGFLILCAFGNVSAQDLHTSRIEEVRFQSGDFEIVGNLHLPPDTTKKSGLVIWIHGSGPDLRTRKFPGAGFFNAFLDNGIAYFRHDNPGHGDSKGSFVDSILFRQRARIVSDAVDHLKKHPAIHPSRIGVAGSSQAGYVIPLLMASRDDIAFIVGLSLPAQTGHEQWAYLLKMQMIHDGYSEEKAAEWSGRHLQLVLSPTHEDFLQNVDYFVENPIHLTAMKGYDSTFAVDLPTWWPLDWARSQMFDPMPMMTTVRVPALILYGALDTQVDPVQGADAYQRTLEAAGNPFFLVKTIPHADHNMSEAVTGSLKEQQVRKTSKPAQEFVNTVNDWIGRMYMRLMDR